MGQVHPTGPNVLKVCQQGGHGCDCSEPRFNPDHALSDVRLSSLVPADDVRDKFRQASNRLRRGRKIVFFAVIFMVVGSQLATIPIRMLRPQTSRCNSCDFNENESGCTNCYLARSLLKLPPKTKMLKLALRILRKSRSTQMLCDSRKYLLKTVVKMRATVNMEIPTKKATTTTNIVDDSCLLST